MLKFVKTIFSLFNVQVLVMHGGITLFNDGDNNRKKPCCTSTFL